jgi:hypothetical protein
MNRHDSERTKDEIERKKALDRELEEGLKGTFPASDPPAVTQPVPHEPPPKKH